MAAGQLYLEEVCALKIRIKFTKTGRLRFIGHLDVMRYFQKLMRRAQVDIRYSEGFSPHQIMSFAQPLGLGDTSEGEYVDIDVLSTGTSQEMIRRLNEAGKEEIRILKYVRIADETRRSNAMSNVAAADYRVYFQNELPDLTSVSAFFSQENICVVKKTKTKEEMVDIRPLIYDWKLEEEGLFLRLSAGSAANLKPDTVMEAWEAFCRKQEEQPDCQKQSDAAAADRTPTVLYHFHRLELYANRDEEMIPLYALGEEITEETLKSSEDKQESAR